MSARWQGKGERGPDRKVRRGSFDRDDRRAQVFRPIADGTTKGALGWIDCVLKTVSEWDDHSRRKGGQRPLGLHGLRVLEVLLGRRGKVAIDFGTGRLDPALDTIAAAASLARNTVIRALARLKGLGLLDWVRRTQVTENAGGYGPQREQISNAYYFTLEQLPKRVLQRFRDLWARKRLAQGNAPPAAARARTVDDVADPALRQALRALEAGVVEDTDASPPSGQYPRTEQGNKEFGR